MKRFFDVCRLAAASGGLLSAACLLAGPALAEDDPADGAVVHRNTKAAVIDLLQTRTNEDITAIRGIVANVKWLPDAGVVRFIENPHYAQAVYDVSIETGQKTPVISAETLRKALERAGADEGVAAPGAISNPRFDETGQKLIVNHGAHIYVVDLRRKRVKRYEQSQYTSAFPGEARIFAQQFPGDQAPLREVLSPDGQRFVFARDHNLWIRDAEQGDETQLTTSGEEYSSWGGPGQWESVFPATWSPDGTRIAATRKDSKDVFKLPLKHWLQDGEPVDTYVYPVSGGAMPIWSAHIVDSATGAVIDADIGPLEGHFINILGWMADGSELLLSKLARRNNRLDVIAVDATTGESRIVLTEANDTFIDTPYTGGSSNVRMLSPALGFLFLSERDGWRHIYHYGYDGVLQAQLTDGELPVRTIVDVDEARGWVYYLAAADSARPNDHILHRVGFVGGTPQRLVEPDGRHQAALSPDKTLIVMTHSDVARPPRTELRRANGELVALLGEADISGLEALRWTPSEQFKVKSRDGRNDIYGVILKPRNFDPARRYPVVEAIYGGMQVDFTPFDFLGGEIVGKNGYAGLARRATYGDMLAVFVSSPGMRGRGKAYHDVMHGIWPRGLVEEHAHAIREAAKTRPWMDIERVGVFGFSWGGYMTMRAMLLEPDFYKAGVSGNPVYSHEDMLFYPEPFIGLPADAPETYADGDLFRRVGNLDGNLRIIASGLDVNATFAHTMRMTDELIKAKKDFDLIVMPGMNHNVRCCGPAHFDYIAGSVVQYLMNSL